MWAVTNNTPYQTGHIWGRDKDGVHEWIVAVKATFDIQPNGTVERAEEQLEPLLLPEFHGEPGVSSLRYDADLLAPKPTTDLIINGTAYAPGGRPSTDFLVEARVNAIHKVLRVVGNRTWEGGMLGEEASYAEPVTEVPVLYERAYGGYDRTDPDPKNQRMDPRNPVGVGTVAKPKHRVGQALPNFEYPGGNIEKNGPAGFGAIASDWSPRREFSGTYDKAWQTTRHPLLPGDWDPRSLLCSPGDQRPASYLNGGEPVELINLTREGRLSFTLPKARFGFTTHISGRKEEHRGQLATVIIEPDYPRLIMVWTTALKCRTDIDYLDQTVVREKRYLNG